MVGVLKQRDQIAAAHLTTRPVRNRETFGRCGTRHDALGHRMTYGTPASKTVGVSLVYAWKHSTQSDLAIEPKTRLGFALRGLVK